MGAVVAANAHIDALELRHQFTPDDGIHGSETFACIAKLRHVVTHLETKVVYEG
jgi:hypothetical protein